VAGVFAPSETFRACPAAQPLQIIHQHDTTLETYSPPSATTFMLVTMALQAASEPFEGESRSRLLGLLEGL
jgi:hypothetical protein